MKFKCNEDIPLFQIPFIHYRRLKEFSDLESFNEYNNRETPKLHTEIDIGRTAKWGDSLYSRIFDRINWKNEEIYHINTRGISFKSAFSSLFLGKVLKFTLTVKKENISFLKLAYEADLEISPLFFTAYVDFTGLPKSIKKCILDGIKTKFGDIEIIETNLTEIFFSIYKMPNFIAIQQKNNFLLNIENGWKEKQRSRT